MCTLFLPQNFNLQPYSFKIFTILTYQPSEAVKSNINNNIYNLSRPSFSGKEITICILICRDIFYFH